MPDMPESVSKGAILKRLDALSQNEVQLRALQAALNVAVDNSDLVQIGINHGILASQEDRDHLRLDWFGHWWPGAQPVQPIIARGLIVAIDEALKPKPHLPLDCYWVCRTGHYAQGGPTHDPDGSPGDVEAQVGISDQQVTLFIHTPGGGRNSVPDRPLEVDEPIRSIVRKKGGIQVIQPKHRR